MPGLHDSNGEDDSMPGLHDQTDEETADDHKTESDNIIPVVVRLRFPRKTLEVCSTGALRILKGSRRKLKLHDIVVWRYPTGV